MLESISSETDFGVIVVDKLRFHVYADSATKKANQTLGVIKTTYVTRDAKIICSLYKSMVRPNLEDRVILVI